MYCICMYTPHSVGPLWDSNVCVAVALFLFVVVECETHARVCLFNGCSTDDSC